jgi:2-hydroxychromene-2-carboxylate isomerase
MNEVDFYFDFSSTNSYFAAFLLPEIAVRCGARVKWLPLHAASLFRETGFDVMAMGERKARYLWRDHERWSELTGLPFRKPSRFPVKTSTALRCVLAAREQAKDAAFAQAVFRAYWERDEDVSDRAVLGSIAREVSLDGANLLTTSDRPEIRSALADITSDAASRGVFGVPTTFVGEEMFWGKDRFEFVERALRAT